MNYRFLRKRAVTVRKTTDVMIGTFCIHHQLTLLHDDRDFDPMVKFLGLEVIDLVAFAPSCIPLLRRVSRKI
ncbi:MAG: hypothetical protein IH628_11115 [Proteobacteria bacterium]|nr:hypothetical protein [Pseudomonadota bacterium]